MKELILYVHGKGGSAEEAGHYRPLFPNSAVVGFDYQAQTPWEAKEEFPRFFARQKGQGRRLTLIANSIGAFLPCPRWTRRWWIGPGSFRRWWIWRG